VPDAVPIDMANMDHIVRERLRNLAAMMQRNPEAARKAIEAIVAGPLRFVPIEMRKGKRYRNEGPMAAVDMVVTECASSAG
jgi:site-specific DNA recombinase